MEWVIEDDFVVLPGMNRTMGNSLFNWRDLVFGCQVPGMKFQVVVERYGLFTRVIDECYANLDLKLSPSMILSDR